MGTLTDVDTHFSFGKNWRSYARLVDEHRVASAETALERLVGRLDGKTFIDIGSGSGVHALAAERLGANRVVAVDVDKDAVETTRSVLDMVMDGHEVYELSVFDMPAAWTNKFDVVYSWGVLHHTGAMREALARAAEIVAPDGLFAFALYRRTLLCPVWRIEKRIYSRSPRFAQAVVRGWYVLAAAALGRRAFLQGLRRKERGMDFWHDMHDWLGGYPYESISPEEVHAYMESLGFSLEREFTKKAGSGVLGSGCDEYVYRKPSTE